MGKKKSKCPIPQKGPNLARRNAVNRTVLKTASEQTERQYMMDTMCLALNAEFGFGQKRLKRLEAAWGCKYDDYREAVTKLPEADYKRERLDGELLRIMGEDFQPFMERYDWMPEIHTGVRKL